MGQTCGKNSNPHDSTNGAGNGGSSATRQIVPPPSSHRSGGGSSPYDEFRFLALGDSYTIGHGVRSAKERWPVQLEHKLLHTFGITATTTIIARTGWTTGDLLQAMEQKRSLLEVQTPYALVAVQIGINNQYQGQSLSQYEKELDQLLSLAVSLVADHDTKRIFVLSLPDYGHTPFGQASQDTISKEVDQFNETCERVTKQRQIQFFNITSISRTCSNPTSSLSSSSLSQRIKKNKKQQEEVSLIADDGLHPTGEQYRRWVETFYQKLQPKLVLSNLP